MCTRRPGQVTEEVTVAWGLEGFPRALRLPPERDAAHAMQPCRMTQGTVRTFRTSCRRSIVHGKFEKFEPSPSAGRLDQYSKRRK